MDGLIWLHNQAGLGLRDANAQIITLTEELAKKQEEIDSLKEQLATLGQQVSESRAE